jgi:hypothetical protein
MAQRANAIVHHRSGNEPRKVFCSAGKDKVSHSRRFGISILRASWLNNGKLATARAHWEREIPRPLGEGYQIDSSGHSRVWRASLYRRSGGKSLSFVPLHSQVIRPRRPGTSPPNRDRLGDLPILSNSLLLQSQGTAHVSLTPPPTPSHSHTLHIDSQKFFPPRNGHQSLPSP